MGRFKSAAYLGLAMLLLLAATTPAGACLNLPGEQPSPTLRYDSAHADPLRVLLHPAPLNPVLAERKAREYERRFLAGELLSGEPTPHDTTEYGISLIYAGNYGLARDVFLQLEQKYADTPGYSMPPPSSSADMFLDRQPPSPTANFGYTNAANLGTAYELAGDLQAAREWIAKGIERNVNSHYGTEWLHLRILDARLALQTDPHWLEDQSVLGVDFGTAPEPKINGPSVLGNDGKPVSYSGLITGLTYQLSERLKFVRDPDPLVAQLLFDLGNAQLSADYPRPALVAYARAQEYGLDTPLLRERVVIANSAAEKQDAELHLR